MEDSISTVEAIQYYGRIAAVLQGDSINTCGGIASVLQRLFSTVGDSISTMEG